MSLICRMVFGSHLYGLQTPSSDKDYKGIYLPTRESLLLGNYPRSYSSSTGNDKSKNTKDDVDEDIYSLPYFIKLACEGDTVAIDMLHSKLGEIETFDSNRDPVFGDYRYIWYDLFDNRTKFYCRDMKSYIGYARKQANKYGIKGSRMGAVEEVMNSLVSNFHVYGDPWGTLVRNVLDQLPVNEFVKVVEMQDKSQGGKTLKFYEVCGRKYQDTLTLGKLFEHVQGIYDEYGDRAKQAKANEGVCWKEVSHALRASYQMLGILQDGDFEYPLPQSDFLLAVKTGQLDFVTEVQPELDNVIIQVERLAETSKLPETVDRNYWDQWLLDVYKEYL